MRMTKRESLSAVEDWQRMVQKSFSLDEYVLTFLLSFVKYAVEAQSHFSSSFYDCLNS